MDEEQKLLSDIQLMKLLVDPRRTKILELASERPVTVGQIAEALGELSSRVYYHVHKLEEAGLLELVETRQHGNLLEKYYSCKQEEIQLQLDPTKIAGRLPLVMRELSNILEPGLKLLEQRLNSRDGKPTSQETDVEDVHVHMSSTWTDLTEEDWRRKTKQMQHIAMGKEETIDQSGGAMGPKEQECQEPPGNASVPAQTRDDTLSETPKKARKSRYAFVVLSYRVEDAERLGFYSEPSRNGETPEDE